MSKDSWKKFLPAIRLVQSKITVLDLLEESGAVLKPRNGEYYCLCPFHKEDHPSFSVNAKTQKFFCFSCRKGGRGPIAFVGVKKKLNFYDALDFLCRRLDVPLYPERVSAGMSLGKDAPPKRSVLPTYPQRPPPW